MKKNLWAIAVLCAAGAVAPLAVQAQTTEQSNRPTTTQQSTTGQQQSLERLDNTGVGQAIQSLSRVDMGTLNYDTMSERSFVNATDVMNENQISSLTDQFSRNQDATTRQTELNTQFRQRNLLRQNQMVVGVLRDGRYIIMDQPEQR
jgi:opacity protein-like surface antigen